MRVQGPTSAPTPTVRRKAPSSGRFSVETASHNERTEQISAAHPLTNLDTLVTLQEAPDDRAARQRAIKRGGAMLDMLDAIRLELLEGTIPSEKLDALLRMVHLQKERIEDPRLSHLLDEIELRARVELAKHGRAD